MSDKYAEAIEHYEYGISHDIFKEPVTGYARLAVEALREKAEREDSKPLTLEYLKEINLCMEPRRWVWIEVLKPFSYVHKKSAYYQVQSDYTQATSFCCGYPGLGFAFDYTEHGKTWLAYATEPKEDKGV